MDPFAYRVDGNLTPLDDDADPFAQACADLGERYGKTDPPNSYADRLGQWMSKP